MGIKADDLKIHYSTLRSVGVKLLLIEANDDYLAVN